ncbi:MAG: hypothetical protein KIT84_13520 [Labilithrix sp.]|nr:hypothetical protein [Labilithrix sp.]MCW5812037.1 hypothetical protein [Labilithrix sp.]
MSDDKPVLWARSLVPAWVPFAYALGVFWVIGLLGHAGTPAQRAFVGALLLVGVLIVFLAWRRRRAEVGAEAIRIRWVFHRRTLRFADVRRAAPEGKKRVVLTTTNGETIELSTGYLDAAMPRDVLERLWKAIASGAEEGSRGLERETLARSGRSTTAWLAALRELGSPGSYRRSTFSTDRLWAIAENPGIAAEIRAGAVVALSASTPDLATRERFRRIGATTVEPSLSALLEDVASGGEVDDRALDGIVSS